MRDALDPAGFAYPAYVRTADDQRRWNLASRIASQLYEEGEDTDPALIWSSTRVIYHSDLRTE